ncbi:DUF4198 domain-containing protein [Pricia sp.]|uniref:DUF4198 domain-containing protein n=1 Tax=Pricia sp. TaxID=2268138 RepID=UPI003592FB91
MKKIYVALIAFIVFSSHDMYLKMDTYFLHPDKSATIKLFNGTFDKSENVIDRDRMMDVSLIGNGNRSQVKDAQWSEKDSITVLNFRTGETGTWVAGVSTTSRTIEMTAADFNNYLEHDGVRDMLDNRRNNNKLESDAVEKYSKHVKVIFQVGDKRTDDWQTELGYPIEFIPLSNPYDLKTGDELKVRLLLKGEPLADQLVYTGYEETGHGHSHDHDQKEDTDHSHNNDVGEANTAEHGHSHGQYHEETEEDHQHTSGTQLRTDSNGIVNIKLKADGIWYLRAINLIDSEESGLTHESNWATLTFEVTHGHGKDSHVHSLEDEGGIPSYVYWIGSLILLGGLFFWFNRKK